MNSCEPLHVPRLVNPITGINNVPHETGEQPFFGYAPGETLVRIMNCPECGRPVSAAHMQDHLKTHQFQNHSSTSHDTTFRLATTSKLTPNRPCLYAERNAYSFQKLIEGSKY
ncbi:hypothetical protein TVAG_390360 [Trichomonas vaginalis G3]|uniref:Uncharacterized protein n=1 Tax=Trichomonas vaginalis (strain ATCC PRA-98 / G3) TaxID=412133 RepID=A2ESU0_TRIV3|nr:hypothetical protein TVAGG3_0181970 [Trichomonas vaginalis G3]EAY04266.1 hypothetical protein TVAG_390360 [Trichomonas vaginalis G3]KAI5549359.1 hypothetical protein TVAGG3_0181970 [Trichomonas vaginalis G3]|eukprot:XP_001316489.1 hypothetical protein [Trichomonas vaginalis G3]